MGPSCPSWPARRVALVRITSATSSLTIPPGCSFSRFDKLAGASSSAGRTVKVTNAFA
jgi:hypothetical protein